MNYTFIQINIDTIQKFKNDLNIFENYAMGMKKEYLIINLYNHHNVEEILNDKKYYISNTTIPKEIKPLVNLIRTGLEISYDDKVDEYLSYFDNEDAMHISDVLKSLRITTNHLIPLCEFLDNAVSLEVGVLMWKV